METNNLNHKSLSEQRHEESQGLFIIMIMAVLGLLTIFVETMLVPGLPIIAENLTARSSDLAWVLTAYTLVGVISVPIVGKLGEMWGRKLVLLAIMAIYAIGIIGAAVSWDLVSLILFRTLQGAGMGAIPLLMGIAKDILPPRMVPVGMGLISAMMGVGAALGLVGGGVLISIVGWKDSFWVVLPIVVLVVAIVHRAVPDKQVKVPAKLDLVGAALLGIGLLTLLLSLSMGPAWGWVSPLTIGLFAVMIVSFIGFYVREKRCDEPIVKLDLLKNRNISAAYISMLFIGMVMFMLFQSLPYFLEMPVVYGGFGITSQVIIGMFLLPNAIAQLIFSPLGGKLGLKVGHWKVLTIGLFVTAAGLLLLSMFYASMAGVLATVTVFGTGLGLATVGNTNMLSRACSKKDFGSATAVNSMILNIGMSIGPIVGSLIIGTFGGNGAAYAVCWQIAALLAAIAAVFVLTNKAHLSVDAPAPYEDHM